MVIFRMAPEYWNIFSIFRTVLVVIWLVWTFKFWTGKSPIYHKSLSERCLLTRGDQIVKNSQVFWWFLLSSSPLYSIFWMQYYLTLYTLLLALQTNWFCLCDIEIYKHIYNCTPKPTRGIQRQMTRGSVVCYTTKLNAKT